jgi:hypothetical protein
VSFLHIQCWCWYLIGSPVVTSPDDWIWRQLGESLSALCEAVAHLAPTVSWLLLQALFMRVLRDEPPHLLSPAGFVSLRFFWMPAPFLFSCVWPYQLVAIAVLVYLQFTWGSVPSSLSSGTCLMSVSVGSLPVSKHPVGGLCHTYLLQQNTQGSARLTSELRACRLLCHVSFFSVACLLFNCFFYFVGWGSVCPWGYVDFSQGWLWENCIPLTTQL